MGKIDRNTLFYGDNLGILREYIDDESVDLIYLDPPFNSNRSYNVLFKDESGFDSEAQISAFDDTWHWGETAEETYFHLVNNSSPEIATMIGAMRQFIGTNQMMAYLVMMTVRLIELYRVLKPNGSLFLHCDPTASHYLKILLDTIFEYRNFQNEITWKRTSTHSDAKKFPNISDTILFYSKTNQFTWNSIWVEHSQEYIDSHYRKVEPDSGRRYQLGDLTKPKGSEGYFYDLLGCKPPKNGWRMPFSTAEQWIAEGKVVMPTKGKKPRYKRYLDELKGKLVGNIWTDIPPVNSQAKDSLDYPTQKPVELLERIIKASSIPNDVVLDPFSGCGTAIAASQKLGRKWIGIDITYLAIALHKNRLKDMFTLESKKDYEIIGDPQSVHDAHQLAQDDRFQFEWWALSLIEARPVKGKKKGSDKGIDGIITFSDEANGKIKQVLVQVKSGHVNSGFIRDLRGTIEREENAVMGIFITLEKPSKNMLTESLEAGYYVSPFTGERHNKIQILTIEELLDERKPNLPISASFSTFKKAERVKNGEKTTQGRLDF